MGDTDHRDDLAQCDDVVDKGGGGHARQYHRTGKSQLTIKMVFIAVSPGRGIADENGPLPIENSKCLERSSACALNSSGRIA